MARRTFTQALSPAAGREVVSFDLAGHLIAGYADDGSPIPGDPWQSPLFRCLPEMPAAAYDVLTQTVADGPNGTTYNVPSVIGFLSLCLIDPDRETFDATVRRKDVLIGNTLLVEVMQWVVEELSDGRPTQR